LWTERFGGENPIGRDFRIDGRAFAEDPELSPINP
jgi:hypothetical protein